MEENGWRLIWTLTQHLPQGTEASQEKQQSGQSRFRPRFEPPLLQAEFRTVTHCAHLVGRSTQSCRYINLLERGSIQRPYLQEDRLNIDPRNYMLPWKRYDVIKWPGIQPLSCPTLAFHISVRAECSCNTRQSRSGISCVVIHMSCLRRSTRWHHQTHPRTSLQP